MLGKPYRRVGALCMTSLLGQGFCAWLPVARFQHSRSVSAATLANVGIKRTTGKYRFLMEFWIWHSLDELADKWVANAKSTPLFGCDGGFAWGRT